MNISSVLPTYYDGRQQATSNPQNINSEFDDLAKKIAAQTASGVDRSTISAEARKMFENAARSNPQGEANGSPSREAWMLERLEGTITYTTAYTNGSNTINLNDGLSNVSEYTTESICPTWYEDLAAVKNNEQSNDIVNEYYGYLKQAMTEVLDEEIYYDEGELEMLKEAGASQDVRQSGGKYHAALTMDQEKSESIQQSVRDKLASNSRATELMGLLGIS